ncbi:elongation factor 1-delta-like [Watersipora subatra]|uniref:elongation factor 1-delta-like n=1 Tax=Watersipora subatra TaxID=2589382 RepID=UPI00355C4B3A
MAHPLATEKIWFDKARVEEAESNYYAKKYSGDNAVGSATATLLADIKNIKDHIQGVLASGSEEEEIDMQRLEKLETENQALKALINTLEARVCALEMGNKPAEAPSKPAAAPAAEEEDDDDIDLFGSDDEEDAEAERIKQERLAAYAAKKAKKPTLIAKSNIILDVKPWDDETDLAEMEKLVRGIEMDGLLWGTAKLVEVGYGIKKLQISCVVEDDKVGTDDLEEAIVAFEDFVQSVDVAAFNKI